MMAIVVALLGAMYCGAALAPLMAGSEGEIARAGGGIAGTEVLQPEMPQLETPRIAVSQLEIMQPGMFGVAPLWGLVSGAVLIVLGLVMMTTFGRAVRHPALATVVLVAASLTALLGVVSVAFVWLNPFSWMTAIVGLAIFIDALCLKLSLSRG